MSNPALDEIAERYAGQIMFAVEHKIHSKETITLAIRCACLEYGTDKEVEFGKRILNQQPKEKQT